MITYPTFQYKVQTVSMGWCGQIDLSTKPSWNIKTTGLSERSIFYLPRENTGPLNFCRHNFLVIVFKYCFDLFYVIHPELTN